MNRINAKTQSTSWRTEHRTADGFTLVEMMVVVGVIGVVASVSYFYLNPFEYFKKARDSQRLQNLNGLKAALVLALQNGQSFSGRCLPQNPCDSLSGTANTDGSGFVDLDLSKYLTGLPRDPSHNNSSFTDGKGNSSPAAFEFAASGSDFEIRTRLESKFFTAGPNDKYLDDGGDDDDYYEVGTRLNIL